MELFTTRCIVRDSDLASIYADSTSSRCRNESVILCNQRPQPGIENWFIVDSFYILVRCDSLCVKQN